MSIPPTPALQEDDPKQDNQQHGSTASLAPEAMSYSHRAAETIRQLKLKLSVLPDEELQCLIQELKSMNLPQAQKAQNPLSATAHSATAVWSTGDKAEELFNNIVLQGDSACRTFLILLEGLLPRFPSLSDVSCNTRKKFLDITSQLGMEIYRTSAICLQDILTIGPENLTPITLQKVQDTPWFFLRMLMSLNVNARNLVVELPDLDHSIDSDIDLYNNPNYVHPLDVLCLILHCSDGFLQKEIFSKLAMCQFAVPLLLPACDRPGCTLMLWAMRDIVKRWRPKSLVDRKGFKQDHVLNIPMPVFSFVRLGDCSLSKSAILNQIISPSQRLHNFFIHRNIEGGNNPRYMSQGLVEMSWNFPAGQADSDIFPEPVAVLNLRGDIRSNSTEFSFLRQISSAVFIFADGISENDCQMLSEMGDNHTTFYFIVSGSPKSISVTQANLRKLCLNIEHVFLKTRNVNEATLVKQIQLKMVALIKEPEEGSKLQDMVDKACKLGINIDENSEGCQEAKRQAMEILKNVEDVRIYKQSTMILQGDLWKKLAETDKELYRMKKQGNEDLETYRAKLIAQKHNLLLQQSKYIPPPPDIAHFKELLTELRPLERSYFLKWMKILLDSISITHLPKLQDGHLKNGSSESLPMELKQLEDQKNFEGSLGVEHFLRELAQVYETECFLLKEKKLRTDERTFHMLPGVAAELLLDGFPLELIDGDAANIPLQWINDVFTELDEKTGGQCSLRVVTILGVQSTGKSTVLNTMFGLQFPVSSGRCTRGAFMTLIKVKEHFQEDLGCHFILVIDTEGLKAPELASFEGSYDHDNELATLVVGLSDITIINMSMENIAEVNDILQIVVHAFLRMKSFGRKPNCRFVHQNVSDVSAHEKNLRARRKFKDQLDKMTRIAAKMEKKKEVESFADVLDHDLENHSVYIPSLWCGDPPMASINRGYSESIYDLKRSLIQFMQQLPKAPQTFYDFSQWLKHLWQAVRHETFIFSFRNSLVASAYDKLTVKYSELQWKFAKAMYQWLAETENVIGNHAAILQSDTCKKITDELLEVLQKEEANTKELLEKFFESGISNTDLIERYKEEFFLSLKVLRDQYEAQLLSKLHNAFQIQKGKYQLQAKLDKYLQIIEEKVTSLLDHYREANINPKAQIIDLEFTKMWNETFAGFQLVSLKTRKISQEIFKQLQKDLRNKPGPVTERLIKINYFGEYTEFEVDINNHIDSHWYKNEESSLSYDLLHLKLTNFVKWLHDKCLGYVRQKANLRGDYQETYCQDVLDMINRELNQEEVQDLHTTALFEMDVKLLILGKAALIFQTMHDDFIHQNDPTHCLERLKPQYFSMFQNIFYMKDECQNRAKKFCFMCLKAAIDAYIYKLLGKAVVDDVLQSDDSRKYSSRAFFQFDLLKMMLLDNKFEQYVAYIREYKVFVNKWISMQICNKYKNSDGLIELHSKILSSITKKIVDILNDPKVLESPDVSTFIETFCLKLNKDLVFPRSMIKVILYKNNASVYQFSTDIQAFLPKTEEVLKHEFRSLTVESIVSKLAVKPEDELFKKIFGCGKQCPFCKVPCEAGGIDHREHFASIHRPQGLGGCKDLHTRKLEHAICTTDVLGHREFRTRETLGQFVPYSEYRRCYSDWSIQPDWSENGSDYWKYVLKEHNAQFAKYYKNQPADIPEQWKNITQEQALRSLEESFNIKLK
ncbi:interferon-induced very large GTPase 1-like [Gastrophryne carolinensis]